MQLAIVTNKVVRGDGQGRVNHAVASEALRRGHRLALVATQVDDDLARQPGVSWSRVSVEGWPSQLVKNAVFATQASRALRQINADAVLACGFACWSNTDVNAVHLVHRAWWASPVHTRHVRSGPYAWYQALYTASNVRLERAALRRTRTVVAVSSLVAEQLAGVVPTGTPVRTIPNGVDASEFAPGPEDRRALGLPEGVPLALFVGDAQTAIKNVDGMLRALRGVPRLHLAVAGRSEGGPYPGLARDLGVSGRVHFLGYRTDAPALMRAADFLVLPSRYDTFGLVVLEAMASARPVVTTRAAGASALVTPECGVVIDDPEDTAALAEAMRSLAADPQRRRHMGRAARVVAERHTFSAMAAEYVDLLEAAAAENPS